MEKRLVITIDGPAGAGKSTVGKALAKQLSYIYLDTGALYRAVAYTVLNEGISPDDDQALSDLCRRIKVTLKNVDGNLNVFIDDENVTEKIRSEEVGLLASKVSAISLVRKVLLSVQREAGKKGGVIAEGRDMGTVVFPNADCKFYLQAGEEERVRRRYQELIERGTEVNYQEIEKDLIMRDKQDSERKIAPLKPSHDAIIIDSTHSSIPEVVDRMLSKINDCRNEI